MSNALKGIDTVLGILKGKTNGAQLSIKEINKAIAEAGAEAGMAGITPGKATSTCARKSTPLSASTRIRWRSR